MKPERDGDAELHEGGYWDVGLCTDVGGSGGVGSSVRVDGTDGAGSGGLLVVVVVTVMVQAVLVEDDCVGVVSGWSSGVFMVMIALEGFGLVLWSSWRLNLWCWDKRGDILQRFSLMSVAGNMLMAVGVCLFGIVIW